MILVRCLCMMISTTVYCRALPQKEITNLLAGVHNCVRTLAHQKLELLFFSVCLVFFVVSLVLLGVGTVCMDSVLNIVIH